MYVFRTVIHCVHLADIVEDTKMGVDSKKQSLSSQEHFQLPFEYSDSAILQDALFLFHLNQKSLSDSLHFWILGFAFWILYIAFKLKCSHDTTSTLSFSLTLLLLSPLPTA